MVRRGGFRVDGGERSDVRHGPHRALAAVVGVGDQDVVWSYGRPGELPRPHGCVPPVVRGDARAAGADGRGSSRRDDRAWWWRGRPAGVAAVVRGGWRVLAQGRRVEPERDGGSAALDPDGRGGAGQAAGRRRAAE